MKEGVRLIVVLIVYAIFAIGLIYVLKHLLNISEFISGCIFALSVDKPIENLYDHITK